MVLVIEYIETSIIMSPTQTDPLPRKGQRFAYSEKLIQRDVVGFHCFLAKTPTGVMKQ
jgi:hypothetical protein